MATAAQLDINTTVTADDMFNEIFGDSISLVSSSYTGASQSSGTFSGGDTTAAELTPADTGVILSTGRASSVTNGSGDVNSSASTSGVMGTSGDSDLNAVAGNRTYDAAILEGVFVPDGSVLTLQVVFSSEEYLEYVDSGFNDAVGVFVNGEKAQLTVGDGDIMIDNINDNSNENLYIDNANNDDTYNTEMDGFTVTLTLKAEVNPGVENTIKIGIADSGDRSYDSNLLIAGGSVQTALVAGDDAISVHGVAPGTVDVLANDTSAASSTLTITAINGNPVVAGDNVTLPSGEIITLNADGTFTVASDADDESTVFSYTVEDDAGNTDVGFVTVTTTPCFVEGTYLQTATGLQTVETLKPGDLVRTRDNGLKAVRWVGFADRPARDAHAPIAISANRFGRHGGLLVSPQHRIVLRSSRAQLLFGAEEVLVKAKDLVDTVTVHRIEDDTTVRYFHVLFDSHQIVYANGLETESYHPGDVSLGAFDRRTRDEILEIMQGLPEGYGPSARPSLRSYEAGLITA